MIRQNLKNAWIFALAIPFLAAGCSRLDIPSGFVAVPAADRGAYQERLISADGVVIGLRTQNNLQNGDLEFWTLAIQNHFSKNMGYASIKAEDIQSPAGRPGRVIEFSSSQSGGMFIYQVGLFVSQYRVTIVEAGGRKEEFDRRRDDVLKSIRSAG